VQIGLCSPTHYLDSVALLHRSHTALNFPPNILILLIIAASPHVLFFTATTTPPQSKTCPLLCIDMCLQLVILNCLRQVTSQLLKVCLFLAAGTTRLSNTRHITTSQHVLCLAAIVPPQSNINHIAPSECVLVSCSYYSSQSKT